MHFGIKQRWFVRLFEWST